MTSINTKGPYVYQPHGTKEEPFASAGRLWAIGGVGIWATKIDGLTRDEADVICKALKESIESRPHARHGSRQARGWWCGVGRHAWEQSQSQTRFTASSRTKH